MKEEKIEACEICELEEDKLNECSKCKIKCCDKCYFGRECTDCMEDNYDDEDMASTKPSRYDR